MKKIITLLFVVTVFFYNSKLYAQDSKLVSSGNSKYFAVNNYIDENTDSVDFTGNIINIYDMQSRDWLQSLKFESKTKSIIDEMGFSFDGKNFFARLKDELIVWNTKSGGIVTELKNIDLIAFANIEKYFVTLKDNNLRAHDCYSGEVVLNYEMPKTSNISDIYVVNNDQYIVAKTTDKKIIVWQTYAEDCQAVFNAREIAFNNSGTYLTILKENKDNIYVSVYELPAFKKTHTMDGYKILNFKKEKMIRKLKANNKPFDEASIKIPKIILNECKLSPSGNYFVIATESSKSERELNIVTCMNGTIANNIRSSDFTGEVNLFPYEWTDDQNIIIQTTSLSAGMFNIPSKNFIKPVSYKLKFGLFEKKISKNDLIENKVLSEDRNFVVAQHKNADKSILYMKSTSIEKNKSKLKNADFLGFSADSKCFFIKNSENKISCIKTSNLEDNPKKLQLLSLRETLQPREGESMIAKDALPPKDYSYVPLNKFKHISTLTDADSARLYFRSVDINKETTGIQVHLMDKNGNYYYGAAEKEWRHIWSKLKMQYPDSSIHDLEDFQVFEQRAENALPNAFALVLDHSGSMGNERIVSVQEAAKDFIMDKREEDAIVVIKYDDRVKVDAQLTTDTDSLLQDFAIDGQKDFGGATALVDAIYKAVAILKDEKGYHRKSIVVLTDGVENSSFVAKNQTMAKALKNGTNIYTIGFGDMVSDDYLRTFAYHTQGSFHHIYGREAFKWILNDVYKKMLNYYTLEFDTKKTGNYKALLELSSGNYKDTLLTTFDNTMIDLYDIDNEYLFKIPATSIEATSEKFADLKKETKKRKRRKKLSSTTTIYNYDDENLDLPYVQFVFDKTLIVKGFEKNIDIVVDYLLENSEAAIEICGHTDFMGSNDYNMKLSMQRAKKVRKLIAQQGIDKARLKLCFMGENSPKINKQSNDARAKNRRVEFFKIGAEQ